MNCSRFITLLLFLPAALLLSACDQDEMQDDNSQSNVARPAKIVPVVSAGINMLRTYPGTLEASEKAYLAFRVSGQLIELPGPGG